MTEDERKEILNEAFPSEVSGYKRGDTVPADFTYSEEFPPLITKDKVVASLVNLIIRQLLSNDKLLKEGYLAGDAALQSDVTSLKNAGSTRHTLTLQGDITGSTTYTSSTDMTITATVKSIKKGMIIMWCGNASDVPSGWAICNGQNGTPDLRNRLVVGVGSRSLGTTGGEETHTLTVSEMPSHQHIVPYGESTAAATFNWGSYGNNNLQGSNATDYDNMWPYTSPTGGSQAHNNMPPYMALYYIMKL